MPGRCGRPQQNCIDDMQWTSGVCIVPYVNVTTIGAINSPRSRLPADAISSLKRLSAQIFCSECEREQSLSASRRIRAIWQEVPITPLNFGTCAEKHTALANSRFATSSLTFSPFCQNQIDVRSPLARPPFRYLTYSDLFFHRTANDYHQR